jgi:hypothetical protein
MRYMLQNELHVDVEELALACGSNEACKTSKGIFYDKFHGKICNNLPPFTDRDQHQLEFTAFHLPSWTMQVVT